MVTINIIFKPSYAKYNKYINNFVDTLKNNGVNIINGKFENEKTFLLNSIKEIFMGKTKIIHLNWPLNLISINSYMKSIRNFSVYLLWFIIIKLLGAKIVWTLHNKISHSQKNQLLTKLFRKIMFIFSDKIVIHNKTESFNFVETINSKYKSKLVYIPHGNYIDNYTNTKKNLKKSYNIKKNDFVFLSLGLIREYKNIDVLIKAFNSLELNERIKLLIVGKAENEFVEKKLKKLSKNNSNIIFDFKFILDEDIVKYLNTADCVITPYDINSSLNSGIIYLALSYEKPIISSLMGTVKDFLDKKYIFYYDYSDSKEHINKLANKINQVSKIEKKHLRELGKMAKCDMQKSYGWEDIGAEMKKVYEELLK